MTLRDTIVADSGAQVDLVADKPATTFEGGGHTNFGFSGAAVGGSEPGPHTGNAQPGHNLGVTLTSDPLLGPLADNGGRSQTMVPAAGSPVIDAGSASA